MITLGIDSASATGGVALVEDGTVRRARDLGPRRGHAEAVVPALLEVLAAEGRSWDDVDLVAVDVGPGSFTGIRVGLAAALGVGESRAIPVVGVGCLDILARACYDATSPAVGGYIVCAADVRRGEVALATFRVAAEGPQRKEEDVLVPVSRPGDLPAGETQLCGDGASLLWSEAVLPRRVPTGPERAAAAARLGEERFRRGSAEAPVPRYARDADARPRRA